jgi:hypothetical protein
MVTKMGDLNARRFRGFKEGSSHRHFYFFSVNPQAHRVHFAEIAPFGQTEAQAPQRTQSRSSIL